jgi:hypothetical protein
MNVLVKQLKKQEDYFGTGGRNTPEFESFYRHFRKQFTLELKGIRAERITFNMGHFTLTGFFYQGGKCVYFSLSDVRCNIGGGTPQLMYRTAKDEKDYTGGQNQYIDIGDGMARKMKI